VENVAPKIRDEYRGTAQAMEDESLWLKGDNTETFSWQSCRSQITDTNANLNAMKRIASRDEGQNSQ
jgi:hypothetical protein